MLPTQPRSKPLWPDDIDPPFMDFSQNSIVVMALSTSQTWKVKNAVDNRPKNPIKVSPNKRKNMVKKGALL